MFANRISASNSMICFLIAVMFCPKAVNSFSRSREVCSHPSTGGRSSKTSGLPSESTSRGSRSRAPGSFQLPCLRAPGAALDRVSGRDTVVPRPRNPTSSAVSSTVFGKRCICANTTSSTSCSNWTRRADNANRIVSASSNSSQPSAVVTEGPPSPPKPNCLDGAPSNNSATLDDNWRCSSTRAKRSCTVETARSALESWASISRLAFIFLRAATVGRPSVPFGLPSLGDFAEGEISFHSQL